MSDYVIVETTDRVCVVTINRPQARNAIDHDTAVAIAAAVDEIEARTDITVAVLTGAGGTFCAGMDLKAYLAGDVVEIGDRGLAGLCQRPPGKPLIAAVEGWALAGGFEVALACDIIVAASDARFGLPEVKRGLVAGGGGLLRLPRRIPASVAMELALTGDPLPAPEAHRLGLVNRVTEPGGALDAALELAARITRNGPLAVAATKQIISSSGDWTLTEGLARQRPILDPVNDSSEDAREGALAFAEKRAPRWLGR